MKRRRRLLVLRVEFLTGVFMATKHDDPSRSTPEWPPHPDRLYSALVAAGAQPDGSGGTSLGDAERKALEWLAEQGSPEIRAATAHPRTTPAIPMPSNPHETEVWKDKRENGLLVARPDSDKKWLPIHRKKVLLPVPAVIPEEDAAWFKWPSAEPQGHREVLESICARVSRLGRSRSLVRVTIEGSAPDSTHVPDRLGEIQLRVPTGHRLCYLEYKYRQDGGKPEPSPTRRYRLTQTDLTKSSMESHLSVFDRFWVFQPTSGDPSLPIEFTLRATRSLRAAILRQIHEMTCDCPHWKSWELRTNRIPTCLEAPACYAKIPSLLSGYSEDCMPLEAPHIAFVSLPFVHPIQPHADGAIKGLGVLIPRDLGSDPSVLRILARALTRIQENDMPISGVGRWRLKETPADAPRLETLDRNTWKQCSRYWTTATPMVFGRFPKPTNGGEVKEVLDSLRLAGIDDSNLVEINTDMHASLHGAPPIWSFRPSSEHARFAESRAWMRHVTLRFDQPVSGPLALGSLRYFGMGLMRPMESSRA